MFNKSTDEEKRKEQPTVLVDSSGNGNLPAGQDPADAQLTALTANVPVEEGDKGSSVESPSEDTGGNAVGCEDQGAEEEDASAAKGLVTRDETKTVDSESIEESSPQSAREKDEIIDEDQKRKKRREDVDGDQGMDVDGETDEHKSEMVEEVVSNDHEAEDTIGNQSGKDDTGITVDEERSKL